MFTVPQLLSTFIGKDEQNITYQPGSLLFHDNATDKEKILAHNEAIDNILDQLQDTLEDAKEASRLRKRSEEARALAMKKQKL